MTVTIPSPMGPALPGTRQTVLAVDMDDVQRRGGQRTYVLSPAISFLPCGLLLWGATNETSVHRIQVGNTTQGSAGFASIPGAYFSHGFTFEQIIAMAESNELDLNLAARQQLVLDECEPGTHLTLQLSGPCDRACFWGRSYSHGRPFERVFVERYESEERVEFRGRVDQLRLGGVDTVLEVTAPSAEVAATLLATMSNRGRYGV